MSERSSSESETCGAARFTLGVEPPDRAVEGPVDLTVPEPYSKAAHVLEHAGGQVLGATA